MKKILLSGLIIGALTSTVMADSNIYAGLSFGKSKFDTGVTNITGASTDDTDTVKGIFVGYNINKYIGVEAAYNDFGNASLNYKNGDTFTYQGTNYVANATGELEVDAKSFGIASVLKYPLHKYFSPYAKIGLHRYTYEAKASAGTTHATIKDHGTKVFFGLGFETNLAYNITARVGYDQYKFEDEDIETTTFSLIYNF